MGFFFYKKSQNKTTANYYIHHTNQAARRRFIEIVNLRVTKAIISADKENLVLKQGETTRHFIDFFRNTYNNNNNIDTIQYLIHTALSVIF